jgi:hypothetical protein
VGSATSHHHLASGGVTNELCHTDGHVIEAHSCETSEEREMGRGGSLSWVSFLSPSMRKNRNVLSSPPTSSRFPLGWKRTPA